MPFVSVVLDTWFMIAILDNEANQNPEKARTVLERLRTLKKIGKLKKIYVLWPVYYETLNTKTVKTGSNLVKFRKFLREFRDKIVEEDDSFFREEAFKELLENEETLSRGTTLSLTDSVIGKFISSYALQHPEEIIVLVTSDEEFSNYVRFWKRGNIRILPPDKTLREFSEDV